MRGRREARQEQRSMGRGGQAAPAEASPTSTAAVGTRFKMRQRMVAIGDDFWIENDRGQKVFKVDGKALRIRGTLIFEDTQGRNAARARHHEHRKR